MKRMWKGFFVPIVVVFVGFAQQDDRRPQPPTGGPSEEGGSIYYQAINLVADDYTKSRIDVPYRIDEQYFIGVRNTDPSFHFRFKRRGEILIELLDKDGISKARSINRFEIGKKISEPGLERKSWYQSYASFSVPPGEYTIVFEVDDLESEHHFLDKNRKVTAKDFTKATIDNSTPLFVFPTKTDDVFTTVNFGGNMIFGKDASLFVQLYSPKLTTEPVRVEYTVSTQNFMNQDPEVVLSDTLKSVPLVHAASFRNEGDSTTYPLTSLRMKTHSAGILLTFPSEKLQLRPFMMNVKIKQGQHETTFQYPFRMLWPEMPMSLRDIDFALDALKYITRENELDSLRSGSRETRLKHLEEFWKTKDPTPNTAYNEVMAEYYRRVDYAMRTFGSLKGSDGFKTDRGRIYILYGPPTSSERSLDPSAGFQEVWVYEKQGKKFVFVDQSKSGNYTLASTQNF